MTLLSVNINGETAAVIEADARKGRTAAECIRRAVVLYSFLNAQARNGKLPYIASYDNPDDPHSKVTRQPVVL